MKSALELLGYEGMRITSVGLTDLELAVKRAYDDATRAHGAPGPSQDAIGRAWSDGYGAGMKSARGVVLGHAARLLGAVASVVRDIAADLEDADAAWARLFEGHAPASLVAAFTAHGERAARAERERAASIAHARGKFATADAIRALPPAEPPPAARPHETAPRFCRAIDPETGEECARPFGHTGTYHVDDSGQHAWDVGLPNNPAPPAARPVCHPSCGSRWEERGLGLPFEWHMVRFDSNECRAAGKPLNPPPAHLKGEQTP